MSKLHLSPFRTPHLRNLAFTLVFSALFTPAALASPPASASCHIDTHPPSEADLAAFHHDYAKAVTLYAAAVKADPTDGRSHQRQVDALLSEGKLDDALKLVDDWTAANTRDPYAIVAAGEVQFDQGHWREAYALMLKALSLNPCFAPAYEGASRFESLAGYHATAHRHLNLAHQLSPNDEALRFEWVNSLNHQAALDALKDLLNDPTFDKKQKKNIADRMASMQATYGHNCTITPLTGPTVIPMTPMYENRAVGVQHWGLEVAFNGHKRTLQIDTGATGFLLSHTSEAGAGLKTLTAAAVGGFGDDDASGATIDLADSIRIGNVEFKDCRVNALNNFGMLGGSQLTGNLDNSPGLVGTNIFDRYLVTLDYLKHEVRLDPLPPPASTTTPTPDTPSEPGWYSADRTIPPSLKSWTEIYRSGHMLIVPTLINNKNPSLFIVDTGNFANLIDVDTAKTITQEQTTTNGIRGLSGTSQLSETGKFTLDFAGLRMPVLSMDALDLSHNGGVHGFLGYPTLSQLILHIDYRDNLMLFEAPEGKKM